MLFCRHTHEDILRILRRMKPNTAQSGTPRALRSCTKQIVLKLGRALGRFIFPLIGLKRILFTDICQKLLRAPPSETVQMKHTRYCCYASIAHDNASPPCSPLANLRPCTREALNLSFGDHSIITCATIPRTHQNTTQQVIEFLGLVLSLVGFRIGGPLAAK